MRSISASWGILCALTVLSMTLSEANWSVRYAAIAVVLLAALKCRIVMLDFMEIRRGGQRWRNLYTTWNLVLAVTLVAGLFLGGQ
jgi:heme/copper-type cytochrome/quinol oxidase subunit 4